MVERGVWEGREVDKVPGRWRKFALCCSSSCRRSVLATTRGFDAGRLALCGCGCADGALGRLAPAGVSGGRVRGSGQAARDRQTCDLELPEHAAQHGTTRWRRAGSNSDNGGPGAVAVDGAGDDWQAGPRAVCCWRAAAVVTADTKTDTYRQTPTAADRDCAKGPACSCVSGSVRGTRHESTKHEA